MRAGIRLAASRGVTSVHDKDGWLGDLRLFQRLKDEGQLSLRVWQSLPHELLPALESLDVGAGLGDGWLRAGYLKAFMDGTLGSQTARMLDGSGVEITSREELEEIVRRGARIGWPVAVHAIGDRANRDALDAFAATRDEWQPKGLRPRIEHAQCLAPEDLPRFAELGVAASVQFSHAPSDRDLAERYWPELVDRAYAFRSLWESGAVVANGSDAPIEELDPLAGIRAGVLANDRRASRVASRAGAHRRAGARGDVRHARVAVRRRAAPRQAPARLRRRLRRPLDGSRRGPRRLRGRGDDGRRPLGPQPTALVLNGRVRSDSRRGLGRSRTCPRDSRWDSAPRTCQASGAGTG